MIKDHYDVVISGAGPAGSMASSFLCKEKIPHLIIDKSHFPRDKVCGDALSGKVLPVLRKLDPEMLTKMLGDKRHFMESHGIRFASPDGSFADIPFRTNEKDDSFPPGFISRRVDFDAFLHTRIDRSIAQFQTGVTLTALEPFTGGIRLSLNDGNGEHQITTRLLIAADGDRSLAARYLAGHSKEPDHYCAGVRAYYSGVTDLHPRNFIELHFLESMLPGYLWVFPLPGGKANVGAGILSSTVSKKRINLRERMEFALKNEPTLRDRFKDAKPEGKIEGWGLPLGSKKRKISGDHFILTGDAASMIDPFTGEGISNAMYCGMRAAETAAAALRETRFDAAFLNSYDQAVYNRLWSELRISRTLQKLCRYPWLFNFVIRKAAVNREFRDTITCMFEDMDMRDKLTSPGFYLRLLFGAK